MKQHAAIPGLNGLRRVLFSALLLIAVLPALIPSRAEAAKVYYKQVAFKDATIKEVIAFLQKRMDINFVLRLSKEQMQHLPRISFNFRDVPSAVVLKYACLAAGLNYYYSHGVLIIGQNLKIPFQYYSSSFDKRDILGDIPDASPISLLGTKYWAPYFVPQPKAAPTENVEKQEPEPVEWVPFEGRISLSNVKKPQKTIRKRKKFEPPPQPVGIVIASNSFLMQDRLRQIVIPKLDMNEMPLPQAVELLRQLSIKYDPMRRGINFFLIPFPGMDKATVTLTLGRMSLDNVVKLVFASGGITPVFGHYVVVGTRKGLKK